MTHNVLFVVGLRISSITGPIRSISSQSRDTWSDVYRLMNPSLKRISLTGEMIKSHVKDHKTFTPKVNVYFEYN